MFYNNKRKMLTANHIAGRSRLYFYGPGPSFWTAKNRETMLWDYKDKAFFKAL
jgi:hypothetical protein